MLSEQNILDGHDVYYITNCFRYINGKKTPTKYGEHTLDNGLHIIRLPGSAVLGNEASLKFGYVKNLPDVLNKLEPDIIMYHGMYGLGLITVASYKRNHQEVKLLGDIHARAENSAKNWISLHLLHRLLNRTIIKKTLSAFDSIFYIATQECEFACSNWSIPKNRMALLPLGGTILPDLDYFSLRQAWRARLGLDEKTTYILHTGKLGPSKRTDVLLEAFSKCKCFDAVLSIVGSAENNEEQFIAATQNDQRIRYFGWASRDELMGHLCAADIYVQPGSVSATFQNALCCRCAGIANSNSGYEEIFGETIWYVNDEQELAHLFVSISENPSCVTEKRKKSFELAKSCLDYRELAKRLYEPVMK